MNRVSLTEKLALIDEYWAPRVVGELNGQYVKLAKLRGEFIWHRHEAEDELFLVLKGRLVIELRDKDVILDAGEFLIVPRGVEHRPVAQEEVQVLLFEPISTVNTGDVHDGRTIEEVRRI